MTNYDGLIYRSSAIKWASLKAVSQKEAFNKLGIESEFAGLDNSVIQKSRFLAEKSAHKMGGPGDLNILYDAVSSLRPYKVIETGVAYGWSSLAILKAMSQNNTGELYSVDMPYPKMGNEKYVGIAIPENLKKRWTLIREPDRKGLEKAINIAGGNIDLCHYDSDKSWWGRAYAFPLLWNALKSGGLFISDDIQDNMYFAEFVISKSLPFSVVESNGKYVGLVRKL